MDTHYLTPLFVPRSIVVFAGSEDDPGTRTAEAQALCTSLKSQHFDGTLTFVDIDMRGTLAELAQARADLAVIALPHAQIAAALEMAGRLQCRAALVLASGLSAGEATDLHRLARREGIHLMGPNGLGFQRPQLHLNASALGALASPGPLALVSQSGALTASILDWAQNNAVGFSTVVSLGPHTAVDLAQVLDFLASDPHTHSIVVYMEGISHARRFMSALRAAAIAKPVLVLKAGRRQAGNEAALTHSATIVGSDDVFDAALRRAGAVRVRSFVQLFSAAKCLASRYRPVGRRLAVVTNGGGPGVLAADWISEIHLELGRLSGEQAQALRADLLPQASLQDLIDLGEGATAEHFRAAIEAASRSREIDGVLAICSPKPGADSTAIAQAVAAAKKGLSKPLLSCWLGDASVSGARKALADAAIPNFRTPEAAVGAFGNIATFYQNQQLLQQTPPPLSNLAKPDIEGARLLIESVLAERRKVLTELESKALLAAFHIPVTQTVRARSANEAMLVATQLGYPVAVKIDSPDVSHKSDVQGVALNVMNAVGVRDVFESMLETVRRLQPKARIEGVTIQRMAPQQRGRELYIGLVTDEPFGPVITFGAGGTMIELINDRSMELPPLNQFLARRLIERARVAETLGAWRGAAAVNQEALEQVLLRVSEMVCELPQLREMDINPIIIDADGAVAVDARIVVDSAAPVVGPSTGPRGGMAAARSYQHLAILPYPARYEQDWPMRGGGQYAIRPIHPDDAQMLQAFVRSMSPESRYFRFVSSMTELPPGMLARFTLIDYDREMALVAVHRERHTAEDGTVTETESIIGVSRYVTNPDMTTCEFALAVSDQLKGQGLGARLMLSIMDFAREQGLQEIQGLVLANNGRMLKLMASLGFDARAYPDDPEFRLLTHAL